MHIKLVSIAIVLLAVLCCSTPAICQTYSTGTSITCGTGVSTCATTSPISISIGDVIVAITETGSVTSCPQSTYTMSASAGGFTFGAPVQCTHDGFLGVMVAFVGYATGSNASVTFTAGYPSSRNNPSVLILKYTGVASSSAVDQTSLVLNTSPTCPSSCALTTGLFATSTANQVIILCASGDNATSWNAGNIGGSPATIRQTLNAGFTPACEDLTVSSIQSAQTASMTANAASNWFGLYLSLSTTTVPPYTTYFLSPTGNDGSTGTASSVPWLTPNHSLNCGNVISAAAGTYAEGNFRLGKYGTVTCAAGNNVAWVKCATAFACNITISAASHDAVGINAPYWGIQGWVVTASTVSTNQCFQTDSPAHHVIFANNVANGCGDGAFTGFQNDYIAVLGNIAYNGAQDNANCYSGIDMVSLTTTDTLPGTHVYISGNFSFGNVDPNPCAGGLPSDGHGISLDSYDTTPYVGQTVIDNNISVYNGASGMQNFANTTTPANVYVRNNTFGYNQTGSINANPCAELNFNTAYQDQAFGNLVEATSNTCHGSVTDYALGSSFGNSTNIFYNNFIYSAAGNNTNSSDGAVFKNNTSGTNPVFVNPVQPSAPNCNGFATVPLCMATVIANFTPTTAAAKPYGYRAPGSKSVYDPLFPQWLCGVTNLPAGLVQMGCVTGTAAGGMTLDAGASLH